MRVVVAPEQAVLDIAGPQKNKFTQIFKMDSICTKWRWISD